MGGNNKQESPVELYTRMEKRNKCERRKDRGVPYPIVPFRSCLLFSISCTLRERSEKLLRNGTVLCCVV